MEALTNMDFKDLNQLVLGIAQKFFQVRENDEILKDDDFNDFLLKVQKAYNALSENEKNLINNEFFYQSYNLWWQGLYSKATFYRYKKEAMMSFLEAFYNE